MASRKRARDERESSEPPKEIAVLDRLRNMWEFASLMQFIFIFGKAVKIDEDFDIEVLLLLSWPFIPTCRQLLAPN